MLSWRVIVPFLLTGTIWGSTWFVITGQIDGVPARVGARRQQHRVVARATEEDEGEIRIARGPVAGPLSGPARPR